MPGDHVRPGGPHNGLVCGRSVLTVPIRLVRRSVDVLVPRIAAVVLDRLDLTELVLDRVDVEAIVDRIDLTARTRYVVTEIDLGRIIRESSSSVLGETVRNTRRWAARADHVVSTVVGRVRRRHAR